jgi:hypothetical protein
MPCGRPDPGRPIGQPGAGRRAYRYDPIYDMDGLQAPGGGSIPADVLVQAQRPDFVILDQSVHGRHRIALVELSCPWDIDAKRAKECKTVRYADLKEELSNVVCS